MPADVETFNRIKVALSLHGVEIEERLQHTSWVPSEMGVVAGAAGILRVHAMYGIFIAVKDDEVVLMRTLLDASDVVVESCRKILAEATSMVEYCGVKVNRAELVQLSFQGDGRVCQKI